MNILFVAILKIIVVEALAGVILVAYFFATICYQAALVFYNAMLPSVSTSANIGVVSGLGVGLGYLGTVFT